MKISNLYALSRISCLYKLIAIIARLNREYIRLLVSHEREMDFREKHFTFIQSTVVAHFALLVVGNSLEKKHQRYKNQKAAGLCETFIIKGAVVAKNFNSKTHFKDL